MTMKQRRLSVSGITSHINLRSDAKYRLLWGSQQGLLYPDSRYPSYPLQHGLLPFTSRKLKKGDAGDDFLLVELEDVEQRTGVVLTTHQITELGSDKLIFGSSDVLTTRLRPNLGKTFLNTGESDLIGTTEWIPLKVNQERILPEMLKYLLLSPRFVDNSIGLLSGKQHPRISEDNLYQLRIPFPPLELQRQIVSQAAAIEEKITTSRTTLRRPVDIINETLCETFGYPLAEHKAREREVEFTRRLSDFGRALTLRSSTRFHHPDRALVDAFFSKTQHEPVKAFLAVPIRLGATLTQQDMDADGEAYCVHPSAIRNEGMIDSANCLRVTMRFFDAMQRRFGLRPGDIVMARSGEGTIGKSAPFDQKEDPFLFSDFTMRLRFGGTMNPRFAAYYFRSLMFQQKVEREKRGMGNMTNIFPGQVEGMLIPDASREQQNELAIELNRAMDALDRERMAIETGRDKISTMIEEALTSS